MQEDMKMPTLFHCNAMMGPHGLYQHATNREPLLSEGYCTDDNARAVQMLVRRMPLISSNERPMLQNILTRCWQFLREAQIRPGYFYNFRSAKGDWLPQGVAESEDMYARIIRALAQVLASQHCSEYHSEASRMLLPLLEHAKSMRASRFWAELLIAFSEMSAHMQDEQVVTSLTKQGQNILAGLWQKNATEKWRWFEERMTYANALFPHGLLASLKTNKDTQIENMVHKSAEFLLQTTMQNGVFVPIGSNGWYPKGGTPSRDNQQAIEPATMLDFLIDYQAAYPDRVRHEDSMAVYLWFFGKNTHAVMMADKKTGACLDGIFLSGPNPNNGAESMLAYQWAEIRMREAKKNSQMRASESVTL